MFGRQQARNAKHAKQQMAVEVTEASGCWRNESHILVDTVFLYIDYLASNTLSFLWNHSVIKTKASGHSLTPICSDWPLTMTQVHNRCLKVAGLWIQGGIFSRDHERHMRPYLAWTFTLQASPLTGTDKGHMWRPGMELLTKYLRVSWWISVATSAKIWLQRHGSVNLHIFRCQIQSNIVMPKAERYS